MNNAEWDGSKSDTDVYNYLKLVLQILTGVVLLFSIWVRMDNFYSLVSLPIMYVSSTLLAFYGKDAKSEQSHNRSVIIMRSYIVVFAVLILLILFSDKLVDNTIVLYVCKVAFSVIPILPSWYSIKDYSEENAKTKKVSTKVINELVEQEEKKKLKPLEEKGLNRISIKKKIKDNEGKTKE
ncbi:hypothetical protein LML60_002566 [Listeria monocytogenes]|nr:hypothetical protein [Listeria monocytogenes]EIL9559322.1 hypothetical protein [Listeria monocytogenes]EIL9716716.1 hypothetical protein [Listeria monocytogenes]